MSIEKSVSLYDIGQSYANIQELLEDDVESEQLEKVLDGLDDKFEEKAENIALEGGKTIEGAYLHRTESLIIK